MPPVRSVPVLLALCISGCTFDFTAPQRDTRATLHVQIFASTPTDQILLTAHLAPGLDTDGDVRSVNTDLLVEGRSIASAAGETEGLLRYEATLSLSDDLPTGRSLAVRAPGIEGLQPMTEQTFDIPVPVQPGPDSLFVNDGDAVVLDIAAPPTGATFTQWWIALVDSAGQRDFIIQGRGSPPEQVVLPPSWFSPAAPVHTVTLDIHQSFSSELVPGRYVWAALVRAQHSWTIVFE